MQSMKLFFDKAARRTIPVLAAGFAAIAFLWAGGGAAAQDLELFEDIERTGSGVDRRGRNLTGNATLSLAVPEFVLAGSSRIGDRRRAVLTHRSGKTVLVPLAAEGQTPVPGHEQFRIVASQGGKVAIQYPAGSPCVEAADRGVSCDAGANVAWLSLRTAPVPEQFVVDLGAEQEEEPDLTGQASDAREDPASDPNNPFARLRAEALGQEVSPVARFRPQRIDPSEVPSGMRVVSTPFGDRLVEID